MQQQQQQEYGAGPPPPPHSGMLPYPPSQVVPRVQLVGVPGPDPLQERPPAADMEYPHRGKVNFDDELAPAVVGQFPDDEEGLPGGPPGNRWPRQETLALLKIRSEMDAAFREATLKGPLWEEISRKLAELGFRRSAKKCKEKFENVDKYYKRTKDGRAGRQDGRSYRFFTQLEALHSAAASAAPAPPAVVSGMQLPPASLAQPISAVAPPPSTVVPAAGMIGFSSSSSSSDSSETDDENREGRKRKRGGPEPSRKMTAFFDRLMKQVAERQDVMQRRFLEAIEKHDQDRMIRDEAWRRQEMTRVSREQELLAKERAAAASRDVVIISYLQRITGHSIPAPAHVSSMPKETSEVTPPQSPAEMELPAILGPQETVASSSRWPKAEVHELIQIRSGLDSKYHDSGSKGPLWEEVSAGMRRLGYDRSAKRCKEKWENINKYFKKVKESNKKRPEDSKTCPYFHQLDALYRNRNIGGGGGIQRPHGQEANVPSSNQLPATDSGSSKNGNSYQGNGAAATDFLEQGLKKPEDIVMEQYRQRQQQQQAGTDDADSDNMDEDEADEENGKLQYVIQFQRPNLAAAGDSTSAAATVTVGSSLSIAQ